jgi:CxxC-x17-CxxC domain-containing protein
LSYTDRVIACADCGTQFVFTAGEQDFYAQRGFTEPPKRCAACRSARKAQRNAVGGPSMTGGVGTYEGGEHQERRQRQMYPATCAECGRTAMVPFQPTGARPVYCSECFQTRR